MSEDIPDFDRIDAAAAQVQQNNNIVPITGENAEAEPEDKVETAELLAPLVGFGFNVFAPNWKVQPTEIEQLSQAYGALIDKYFPDTGLDQFGAEISALMITAAIIAPRMKIPRKPEAPKQKEKKHSEEIEKEAA